MYQLDDLDKTIFLLELSIHEKPKIIYATQNISDPHDFENLEKCIINRAEFVTKESQNIYISSKEIKDPHNHNLQAICNKIITNTQQGNCIIGEGVMNFYTYTFTLKDRMVRDRKRIFLFLIMYSSLKNICHSWGLLQNTLVSFATNLKVRAKVIFENEIAPKQEHTRSMNELLALNVIYPYLTSRILKSNFTSFHQVY